DASEAIKTQLAGVADRVIMPLPERAREFIGPAVLALKGGRGVVHYFAHIKADGNKQRAREAGAEDATEAFAPYAHEILETTVVREVGPRVYQIVADVKITREGEEEEKKRE
ncbi:MAG TPA: hypothetical protein VHA09_01310, partial [Nitrososphaera sp.]|nr:hypothetical protein [Nitrososphaera sp.]